MAGASGERSWDNWPSCSHQQYMRLEFQYVDTGQLDGNCLKPVKWYKSEESIQIFISLYN